MVVVTYDPRGFPSTGFVLPQYNKLRLADWFGVVMSWMGEVMRSHFDGTVPLQIMGLQSIRNQFTPCLATNEFSYRFDLGVPSSA